MSRILTNILKIEDIEDLGLSIGMQTRYSNTYIIELCIKHNKEMGGAKNIEILKDSFLKLPMFRGLKIT